MLDKDLAVLYQVETRVLNQAVRRNIERFPKEFMFQLSSREFKNLKSQFVISSLETKERWGGRRKQPFAFTEHGVAMLSGVLNSKRAIAVNIQIVRIFMHMREMMLTHKGILLQLEKIEKRLTGHDKDLQIVFEYLKQLLNPVQQQRRRIGFKMSDE